MDARWVGFHPPEAIAISHLLELSFGSAKDEEKENTGTWLSSWLWVFSRSTSLWIWKKDLLSDADAKTISYGEKSICGLVFKYFISASYYLHVI